MLQIYTLPFGKAAVTPPLAPTSEWAERGRPRSPRPMYCNQWEGHTSGFPGVLLAREFCASLLISNMQGHWGSNGTTFI
jgi:hypothetical protein